MKVHTITKTGDPQTLEMVLCLQCGNPVAVLPGFASAVRDDSRLMGYLHCGCEAAWEEAHPSSPPGGD